MILFKQNTEASSDIIYKTKNIRSLNPQKNMPVTNCVLPIKDIALTVQALSKLNWKVTL